jgi:addiction module RelB/DinJ family antitoxin
MNTAGIYIKTQPEVKAKAEKIAKNLGLSLNSLMDAWLRQFVKTKRAPLNVEEKPSKYLIESIRKSEEQLRKGETSPAFDNAKDAIAWLEKQGV